MTYTKPNSVNEIEELSTNEKNIKTVNQAVANQNKPSRIVFTNSLSIFIGYHVKIYQTIKGAIK